ncbi:MAG: OadG family protein [Verrucomicrobia bacterium]|nr:OadG family protein [Verrucomicrobiota bacterium]MCH8526218.1 OadG family protein [Kiritimatiellia bacterium]
MSTIWNNITENNGFGIAGAGILLVFSVLILVSLYIAMLPRLLSLVSPLLDPRKPLPASVPAGEGDLSAEQAAAAASARHFHLTRTEG